MSVRWLKVNGVVYASTQCGRSQSTNFVTYHEVGVREMSLTSMVFDGRVVTQARAE